MTKNVRKIMKKSCVMVSGFVEPSFCLVRFDNPTRIILRGFLMGDLLKLSPWSEGLGR